MAKKNRNPYKPVIKLYSGPALVTSVTFFLALALVFVFIVFPHIIKQKIKAEAQLADGSATWKKWKNPPFTILIKFYVFNVTLLPDAGPNKPAFQVQETGPYVWEEKRTREIQSVNEDEDFISYKEVIHFHFRPDLSNGNEDDVVDIVNIPLISFAYILYKRTFSFLANTIMGHLVDTEGETLVQRGVKVRDLIFDGIQINPLYESYAEWGGVELPEEFANGKFAIYNGKNGTFSPEFKVNRGMKDFSRFGDIVGFNDQRKLTWWKDQYCNTINGSDGGMYPPFVSKDRTIHIFQYEICRSIYMDFVEERDYRGVPAYRFKIPSRMFDKPEVAPHNECYNTQYGHDIHHYEYRGAYRIFTCKGEIPLIVSNGHFETASQRAIEGVIGVTPNGSMHESELFLEPESGALLKIAKRIQISLEHITLPGITGFEDVYHAAVPIVWVEESVEIDEDSLSDLRHRLIIPRRILYVAQWFISGAAIVYVIFGLGIQVLVLQNRKKEQVKPDSLPITLLSPEVIEKSGGALLKDCTEIELK